jgi:aconitate hydratase
MNIKSPFAVRETLRVGAESIDFFSLPKAQVAGLGDIASMPYCLKVLLENLIRQVSNGEASDADLQALVDWRNEFQRGREIGFKPARVMMVDSSGIPCLGDLAAMRDAMVALGGDPTRINPAIPVDFIVDHSISVDHAGSPDALRRNRELEFQRNGERYAFLKWGAQAFSNVRLIPPGTGICHQINLEFLAQVVCISGDDPTLAIPDSVLGMDSHTPMINSLGVLGWGVGGLEGGTAAMGEPVSIVIPEVVGCRLVGKPQPGVTTTDIVLTVTETLRRHRVVGCFVEYCGEGLRHLSTLERATISNMTPELGATVGFFPIDGETLRFLRTSGRTDEQVELVEAYAKAQGLWRDEASPAPQYSREIEIDLTRVQASLAGPSRPHQRVPLPDAPQAFCDAFPPKTSVGAETDRIADGDIIIAAITSCTNTSNPHVMVAAGLLARNAVRCGLRVGPRVKTSLSPGSRVVTAYLEENGLLEPLRKLGFEIAGYGCMTCIGNSGPIDAALAEDINSRDVSAVAVLSGNRNFEGRVHPSARANFLASPQLVVAYALAGSILKDLTRDPLGHDEHGNPVMLAHVWPDSEEVRRIVDDSLKPELFLERYAAVEDGDADWRAIEAAASTTFEWEPSTFVLRPPFFDAMTASPEPLQDIHGARILAMFGDMLTTDHISPIGAISPGTSAADYLEALGIAPCDFVSYGARRLNHHVMTRGTFANIRIRNELTPEREGGVTRVAPAGDVMSIFDAAKQYEEAGVAKVVVGGADYGAGSSRDWAAKGTRLLGVRAVIAESFERIHRSNLVGIGVLPLQFAAGTTRRTLELDGFEQIDIDGLESELTPRMSLSCRITRRDGHVVTIPLTLRLDTQREIDYVRHGGILHCAIRERME